MAAHAYALRSKLNNSGVSLKNSPANSPFAKTGTRSPRKTTTSNASLNLQHVIGTTTTGPTGFSCHVQSNTYAYCAGSTVVLAKVEDDGNVSQRFFKARPTASSVNPCISFYDQSTPTGTPRSKRKSVMPARLDGYGSTPMGSPFREWSDDGNGQTWTARERIKAASSVSISPDGKLLAVGETGYNPRVLIFSTAEDAIPNIPLSIMSEHTYGVRAVAFSPDSKYLATLGDINDGFLFMWAVNVKNGSVKLHSANRCTTTISDMIWCGNTLITVGTRHVKAWRISEPAKPSPSKRLRLRSEDSGLASPTPQTLSGRNVLLGGMVDENFTSAEAMSSSEAVVCTENGHVCLIKDEDSGPPTLKVLRQIRTRITCTAYDKQQGTIALGDRQGSLHAESFAIATATDSATVQNGKQSVFSLCTEPRTENMAIIAVGALRDCFVTLDSSCHFRFIRDPLAQSSITRTLASHEHSIRGLQLHSPKVEEESFLTWSAGGQVMNWDRSGALRSCQHVSLEQVTSLEPGWINELKVVRYIPKFACYVSADRLGILQMIGGQDFSISKQIRAHGSEIMDIAVYESELCTFVATSGRDRIVQLFRATEGDLKLAQTLDEHIGAVTEVTFSNDGERLLSASADRTIIVRDKFVKDMGAAKVVAYLSSRIITLKATPLSMALLPGDADSLIVSTMDRNVLKLTISTGAMSDAFKVTDPENDDTVILSSICVGKSRVDGAPRLLVGCSSTDKSIRVYDLDREILLAREAGHTEGISEVALREDIEEETQVVKRSIISTGLDGTIMTWNLVILPPQGLATPLRELSQGQAMPGFDSNCTPVKPSPASLPPLRKVLTDVDIAQFTAADSLTGSPIQASLRNPSPSRLHRRPSRLTLAHSSIDEHEAFTTPTPQSPTCNDRRRTGRSIANSPSPPPVPVLHKRGSHGDLHRQRSRPDLKSHRTTSFRRCPSPTNNDVPNSNPVTPRNNQKNEGRLLRRPSSVSTDLRGHALRQSSKKPSVSLSGTTSGGGDLGGSTITSATEQACRMLRAYRTRVLSAAAGRKGLSWDEVENELQTTLNAVRERKVGEQGRGGAVGERSASGDGASLMNGTGGDAAAEVSASASSSGENSDVEGLRVMFQRTSVGDNTHDDAVSGRRG